MMFLLLKTLLPVFIKRSIYFFYMSPEYFVVFVLAYFGLGTRPVTYIPYILHPLILILTRSTPLYVNLGLLGSLGLGTSLAYYEKSNPIIKSPFEDYRALAIVGGLISILTILPGVLTKFLNDRFGTKDQDISRGWKINYWSMYPIIWTLSWSIYRRYSPVGSWGDWSYTLDSSGYSGSPVMQLASLGGLSAINLFLSTWSVIVSNYVILRCKIQERVKRIAYNRSLDSANADEETPFFISVPTYIIPTTQNTSNNNNNERIIESNDSILIDLQHNLKFNNNIAIGFFALLLFMLFFYNIRLNNFESGDEPVELIRVGCMLPSYGKSTEDILKATVDLGTSKATKIVLWSESAISLNTEEDYEVLLANATEMATKYHFWLGFTYTIPTGYSSKKKNMLTFVGNDEILFNYQKTHPVLIAESWSTEGGKGKLEIVDIKYKEKNKKHHHNYTTDLRISGAICLDMDFPDLLNQASSANLILSPAQTFSTYTGLQHLRMTSVRAIENGYWILRCDQGGVSGLIDPLGRIRNYEISTRNDIQVITWDVPFDSIKKVNTFYGSLGESIVWTSLGIFVFLRIFVKERHFNSIREHCENFYNETIDRLNSRAENIIISNSSELWRHS